jgi:hypothetical protein
MRAAQICLSQHFLPQAATFHKREQCREATHESVAGNLFVVLV